MKTAINWRQAGRFLGRQALLAGLTAGLSSAAMAQQQPVFLGDHNTSVPLSGYQYMVESIDGVSYFEDYIYELDEASLWQTDGTAAGTRKWFQFSAPLEGADQIISHNGYMYIDAFGANGRAIIKVRDGQLEKIVAEANEDEYIASGMAVVEHGLLMQKASRYEEGVGLYLVDADDELSYVWNTDDYDLYYNGEIAYFSAGEELWRTDGTTDGTTNVLSGVSYEPYYSLIHNDKFFFQYSDSESGYDTVAAVDNDTTDVKALVSDVYLLGQIVELGDNVAFFTELDDVVRLHISDGTPEGTVLAADLYAAFGIVEIETVVAYDGKVAFSAEMVGGDAGVFITDGTVAGTILLTDEITDKYVEMGVSHGLLYFAQEWAPDGDVEVWVSDGTAEGTRILPDVPAGIEDGYIQGYKQAGDATLFLVAYDDPDETLLMAHNPVTDEVYRVYGDASARSNFEVRNPAVMGNKIFFRGFDGEGFEPWVSDGTADNTFRLGDFTPDGDLSPFDVEAIFPGENLTYMFARNGRVNQDDNPLFDLLATDGTDGGTTVVLDDVFYENSPYEAGLWSHVVMDDIFYFYQRGSEHSFHTL